MGPATLLYSCLSWRSAGDRRRPYNFLPTGILNLNPSLSCGFAASASAVACALIATVSPALAQSYPAKPIRIIAAQSAGGGTDLFARMLGQFATSPLMLVVHPSVPFKGVAPSVTAVIAGQIDLTFATIAAVLPQVKAQRLRALAVSTPKRSQIVPDLPTVAESGVPGYEVTTWFGLFGPTALPKDIVAKLNAEVIRILALPDVRERLYNEGAESSRLTVDEFSAFVRADAARWANVIKAAGIKAEQN